MEIQRKIISDFVGLDSKTYSLIDVDNEENKKVKSVNKNVVKNIRHRKCIDVSFNKKKDIKWKEFKVDHIKLELTKMVKSCFDDKRYILDDGINSLSYFKVYWKNKSN